MSDNQDDNLRAMCEPDGDWGGTPWALAIQRLLEDRDGWRDQVVTIRAQQRAALRRAEEAERAVRSAHTYCARPEGVCLPVRPLPRREGGQ